MQGIKDRAFWDSGSIAMIAIKSEEMVLDQCRDFLDLFQTDAGFNTGGTVVNSPTKAKLSTMSGEPKSGGRSRRTAGTP